MEPAICVPTAAGRAAVVRNSSVKQEQLNKGQSMESSSSTIHARVGSGALDKADRLFRNDDTGTFVELLQNSRRAGATVVEVTITELDPSNLSSVVTIYDNGRGIQDFAQLLTLWESGWDQATKAAE